MTPRQYFLSPRTIAAYRHALMVGQEQQRVAHRHPGVARRVAFPRWLQQQIPHHTILVVYGGLNWALPQVMGRRLGRFDRGAH